MGATRIRNSDTLLHEGHRLRGSDPMYKLRYVHLLMFLVNNSKRLVVSQFDVDAVFRRQMRGTHGGESTQVRESWGWIGRSQQRGPGRARTQEEIQQFVVCMSTANRDWGFRRIWGEFANPGQEVARTTIANVLLKEHGLEPASERNRPPL